MTDKDEIWLSPICEDERTWCQHRLDDCPECGAQAVKYVRSDLLDAKDRDIAHETELQLLLAKEIEALRDDCEQLAAERDAAVAALAEKACSI